MQPIVETLPYIAPELHIHNQNAQYYSDIWSLGVTTIEWLTFRRAWDIDREEKNFCTLLVQKKRNKEMPEGLARVAVEVKGILEKSLSYEPKIRPTAKQLAQELCKIAG